MTTNQILTPPTTAPINPPLTVYAIFHLNLAYSSIEHYQRQDVLERCYWPLLNLVEEFDLPIGIEASGYTLESIEKLDPQWIERLRYFVTRGVCDFIGGGYTQLIGPLVPEKVNAANISLGNEVYQDLLGLTPRMALVNEQALSSGLVSVYRECGIETLIMDWDNPATFHSEWDRRLRYGVQRVRGTGDDLINLLWNSSIAFQQFQRYVAGETQMEDLLAKIHRHRGEGARIWPLYGNDVEVFGFRAGRFATEPAPRVDEWDRIRALFACLKSEPGIQLDSAARIVSRVDAQAAPPAKLQLTSAQCPIPVKKQPKYNISRWAVSGRDDLWLNTACHRLVRRLPRYQAPADRDAWRGVCRAWASDLRTHTTPLRWQSALDELQELALKLDQPLPPTNSDLPPLYGAELPLENTDRDRLAMRLDTHGHFLTLETAQVRLVLNLRRGLAIHSAGFGASRDTPSLGTLPHGYFDSVELGADFYSGGVVIELQDERRRITDLHPVTPRITVTEQELVCEAVIDSDKGAIHKRVAMDLDQGIIRYEVGFPNWTRPMGTVRVGHVTLLPEAFSGKLRYECTNGGRLPESFMLDKSCIHSAPVSTLVTCTTGLGATDGQLRIGDENRSLLLTWSPSQCAAFPMIYHRESAPSCLTRAVFSLCELDETSRAGGHLLPFVLSIQETAA